MLIITFVPLQLQLQMCDLFKHTLNTVDLTNFLKCFNVIVLTF